MKYEEENISSRASYDTDNMRESKIVLKEVVDNKDVLDSRQKDLEDIKKYFVLFN